MLSHFSLYLYTAVDDNKVSLSLGYFCKVSPQSKCSCCSSAPRTVRQVFLSFLKGDQSRRICVSPRCYKYLDFTWSAAEGPGDIMQALLVKKMFKR